MAGLGLDTTLQLLPFQCSTRLCWIYRGVPLGEGENPTAQTLLEETTATAFSWLPYVPEPTFGLDTIFQVPVTDVVGPGVGVEKGAWVGVGVLDGTGVGVGVFLPAEPAWAGFAPAPINMTIRMPASSNPPVTGNGLLIDFRFVLILFLPQSNSSLFIIANRYYKIIK